MAMTKENPKDARHGGRCSTEAAGNGPARVSGSQTAGDFLSLRER